MKIFKQLAACLLVGVAALGLSSCDKNKYEEEISSFKVVKTEFPSSKDGGEGLIVLSEGGFEASTADAWVVATKSGEKEVKLTIEPNPTLETRVTNVIIKKDKQTLTVPITQRGPLGGLRDMEPKYFSEKGGSFSLDLSHLQTDVTVSLASDADWLSYTEEAGVYTFTVAPEAVNPSERSTQVVFKSGFLERSLTVIQEPLTITGVYRLSYTDTRGERKTAELTISGTNFPGTYLMYGAILPMVAQFEPDSQILVILTNSELPSPPTAEPGDRYILQAFAPIGSRIPPENGNHFFGSWVRGRAKTPTYVFTPKSEVYSFLVFLIEKPGQPLLILASDESPSTMSELVIEWLRPLPESPTSNNP